MPAYNAEAHLKEALDSVLGQTYRAIEVIVVDDGSSDATADIVQAFRDVRYIRQSNRGPSAARNRGIQAAQGEFVAFLDADDVWEPEKLSEQLTILDDTPEAALIFSDMRLFNASNDRLLSMFSKYGFTDQFFGDSRRVLDPVRKLVQTNYIPTSSVLARKDVVLDAGAFDEGFCKAEDWDLWLRIAVRRPIVYCPNILTLKRIHNVNTSRDAEGMNEAAIRVLEKFHREYDAQLVQLGVDMGSVLRDGYRNLGYFYLRQLSVAQARAALRKSLSLGFQMRALVYFISTLLGRRFVGSVVRARG